MKDWADDLPPAAHARIDHQRSGHTAGSLLSVAAAASIRSAGLSPVGEVFGCVVMNLGWSGTGCAWNNPAITNPGYSSYSLQAVSPVSVSSNGSRWGNFAPYVKAYEQGWNGALRRLLAEARALGAHGVVDVRTRREHVDGSAWEFSALGTAVISTDPTSVPFPAKPGMVWSTNLSGEDCAAAILSGFVPHQLVMGMSVSTKHADWLVRQQRSSWVNGEVTGMTQVIQAARNDARSRLARSATHTGAAELVITDMFLREFESRCGNQEGEDLHAESVMVGTTLVALPRARRAPVGPQPLTFLPLRDAPPRPPRGRAR